MATFIGAPGRANSLTGPCPEQALFEKRKAQGEAKIVERLKRLFRKESSLITDGGALWKIAERFRASGLIYQWILVRRAPMGQSRGGKALVGLLCLGPPTLLF
jgi:hypothetical protein